MAGPAHTEETSQLLQNLLLTNALLSHQLRLRGISLDETHPALSLTAPFTAPFPQPLPLFTPLPFAPAQTAAPSPFSFPFPIPIPISFPNTDPLAHTPVITLPPLQQTLPLWDTALDVIATTLNPSTLHLPAFPAGDDTGLSSTVSLSPPVAREAPSAVPVRKRHPPKHKHKDYTRNKNRSYNAFFVFMLQKRDDARRTDPFVGYKELTKRLAAEWAALPQTEKAIYKFQARQMADAKNMTPA